MMRIALYILQTIGILIPTIGIFWLIGKVNSRMSVLLLISTMGCLIMNSAYVLVVVTSDKPGATMAYKMEYFGSTVFYLFFGMFVMRYLKLKWTKLIIFPWLGLDLVILAVLWSGKRQDLLFSKMEVEQHEIPSGKLPTDSIAFSKMEITNSFLQQSRYVFVCVILTVLFIYTILKMMKLPKNVSRRNLAKLARAEFIIVAALIIWMHVDLNYDFAPILSSLALLSIIIGVISGSFFGVIESGKAWFVENMPGALIITDLNLAYQDANKYAKKIFPELEKLSVQDTIPEKIRATFERGCEIDPVRLQYRKKAEQLEGAQIQQPEHGARGAKTRAEVGLQRARLLNEYEKKWHEKGLIGKLGRFLEGNETVYSTDEILSDNGEICVIEYEGRYYNRMISPITQKEKVAGYCLLFTDITEQRAMVQELEIAKDQAEAANRAKSAFMSNMSHEIRTPMNAIVGMTDILLREDLPARDREYLANIRNSGDALLSIINDILDFSKIEAGKLDIVEDEYEPMSMLNDLSMIFLNRIGQKPIELLYDIDRDLPLRLYGDDKRIRQIIINIMNNAVKFTEAGFVRLSLKADKISDDKLFMTISIKDTGQGIKKEDQTKLFGAFTQVDTKRNREKEGTGLGLSICKNLVELMGGKIWVESEYGEGSTFSFSLTQKIIDPTPATYIKNPYTNILLCGMFENELIKNAFEQLSETYGFRHNDALEESRHGDSCEKRDRGEAEIPSFLFTDSDELITPEMMSHLEKWGTSVCVIQNPMQQNLSGIHARIINKPLYSLNFCQSINHEEVPGQSTRNDTMFEAPDAKVLVVDDNEINLKVACGLLEPLKMNIDTAHDGKEAVAMVKSGSYNLVFMDHMMPVMDGIEATELLRSAENGKYSQLPIIALSANATSEARELFKTKGFSDFVPKPIQMKDICKCIRKWLPAEMIREVSENSPSDFTASDSQALEDKSYADEILSGLQRHGLDTAAGIESCGSRKLYLSLLSDYYKLIDKKTIKIEKCLADGLLHDVTIEVHALKNTSRMIGALPLSEEFYELEQLGNSEDASALNEKVPQVLEHFKTLKPILEPFARQEQSDKREASPDELITIVTALRDAMESFDLDMADDALKELLGCRVPPDCEQAVEDLDALVADVDMENVIRLCDELVAKLKSHVV